MFENPTDHGSGPFDAPTRPVPVQRPQSLLASAPVDRRPPMAPGRLEPMEQPVSMFDQVDGRTVGLVASMVLGGLLLVAVAVALLSGDDTSTAAGPGEFDPAALASGSPDPDSSETVGQFPSSAATSSLTTMVETSITTSSTVMSTTTTAAPTTAAPTTPVPTTEPPTTAAPTTEAPTTVATDPSTTSTTETPSSETTASATTGTVDTTMPTTTPTTAAGPSGDDGAVQQQVLDATNAERAANGCGPLTMDPLLNQAADGHSEDMAARGYFSHEDPEGRGPGFRIDAVAYPHRGWGENIAAGYGSAAAVVEGWMNSPGHRANIVNCAYDQIGIGYAEPGRYWTQLFATRR